MGEETTLWGERVTQAESYTRRFKILISPMIYKDKIAFLVSHISVMENNVNEKTKIKNK